MNTNTTMHFEVRSRPSSFSFLDDDFSDALGSPMNSPLKAGFLAECPFFKASESDNQAMVVAKMSENPFDKTSALSLSEGSHASFEEKTKQQA